MYHRTPTLLLAALIVASSFAIPAESAGKKNGAASSGAALPMSTMAPLTQSECERLGGTVIPEGSMCKGTGKACFTNTLNNGAHTVCITEAN
jgi:hypothetical protein